MSYLHSSEQKTNFELKSHECVCKNHNYCNVKMPEAHNKVFNLIRNNNLSRFHLLSMDTQNLHSKKKLLYDNSLTKLYKYAPCAYSLFTQIKGKLLCDFIFQMLPRQSNIPCYVIANFQLDGYCWHPNFSFHTK